MNGLLQENLVGVYLHGSLAMACFDPESSDIDLIVVTGHSILPETKRSIVEHLLWSSTVPSPIEITFLRQSDLTPWQYPTPFELHYSEMWREQYRADLESGEWRRWNEQKHYDEDLAAHLTILWHRGICLSGQPIRAVFSVVPPQDYLASILSDVKWAQERGGENPTYLVLNVCRVYAYVLSGAVYSKDEGGVWAINTLPQAYRQVVTEALDRYRGNYSHRKPMDHEKVEQFVSYMDQQIQAALPNLLKPKT